MRPFTQARDWLDARTGYRSALRRLLDEPLPPGVNWWFVLGSVLLFLLVLQFLTGFVLALFYVPSPDAAYDSVRFLTTRVTFGRIIRGLHVYGASFLVVALAAHLLRTFVFGAYKPPREATWISGVLLLLVVLAFSLTGYLLPWDRKAYWATVVTVNIARSAPVLGDRMADLLRGGPEVGALTLTRWYAAHVLLLPAALIGLVGVHLVLLRRQGTAGPITPKAGVERPFYPDHAVRDTVAIAVVFVAVIGFAALGHVPLDFKADPGESGYSPRPEWYFMGLFQLLKYFPGRLEPIGAIVIPTLAVLALLLLPFIDRSGERQPRARRPVMLAGFAFLLVVILLTGLGLRDAPRNFGVEHWSARAVAGHAVAASERCTRCHSDRGVALALSRTRVTRDEGWIRGHVADPDMIVPGLREAPRDGLKRLEALSVIAYARRLRSGATDAPPMPADEKLALTIFGARCSGCHVLDGEGEEDGPTLTRAGEKRDAAWLRRWITDPEAVDPDAEMPSFGTKISEAEMTAMVNYLAARK